MPDCRTILEEIVACETPEAREIIEAWIAELESEK